MLKLHDFITLKSELSITMPLKTKHLFGAYGYTGMTTVAFREIWIQQESIRGFVRCVFGGAQKTLPTKRKAIRRCRFGQSLLHPFHKKYLWKHIFRYLVIVQFDTPAVLNWDAPPRRKCHHEDYYMFGRGSIFLVGNPYEPSHGRLSIPSYTLPKTNIAPKK